MLSTNLLWLLLNTNNVNMRIVTDSFARTLYIIEHYFSVSLGKGDITVQLYMEENLGK